MALLSTNAQGFSLLDDARGLFAGASRMIADWRLYRRTLDELNGMSDRELSDLGLSRHVVRQVARDSVYGY